MYIIKEDCYIKRRDGQIIIGNRDNGKWIRISESSFEKINKNIGSFSQKEVEEKYGNLLNAGIITKNSSNAHEAKRLESIMIAITNKCNLSCLHCGFSAGPTEQTELSLDEVNNIIKKNKDVDEIVLTGGEPLIHKDFVSIAKSLDKYFLGKKTLMTNATLVDSGKADLIAEVFDDVSISIDGATKKSCDQMRGRGVFKKVLKVVKQLKERDITELSLSMTLTDLNRAEEKNFIELCRKIGVEPIIRDLFITGRAKKNAVALNSNDDEPVNLSDLSRDDFLNECKKLKLNGKCKAGKNSIYVQYDGGIYPCPVAAVWETYKIGDLSEIGGNMSELLAEQATNPGLKAFFNKSPEIVSPCRDCSVNMFCWGCLQEYHTYVEDEKFFPVFCKSQKNNLEKIVWGDF